MSTKINNSWIIVGYQTSTQREVGLQFFIGPPLGCFRVPSDNPEIEPTLHPLGPKAVEEAVKSGLEKVLSYLSYWNWDTIRPRTEMEHGECLKEDPGLQRIAKTSRPSMNWPILDLECRLNQAEQKQINSLRGDATHLRREPEQSVTFLCLLLGADVSLLTLSLWLRCAKGRAAPQDSKYRVIRTDALIFSTSCPLVWGRGLLETRCLD